MVFGFLLERFPLMVEPSLPLACLWRPDWRLMGTRDVTDRAMKCFGESEGLSISGDNCLLHDSVGGFWIGGMKGLIHWRNGGSQSYPIEALKNNDSYSPLTAVARTAQGTLWAGALEMPPGLAQLCEAGVKSFVTPNLTAAKFRSRP